MVDSVSSRVTCPSCGAENLGTRFCESCGAPAPALTPVVAISAPITAAPPVAAASSTGSGWRVALLIVFIAAHVIPSLIEVGIRAAGSFDPAPAQWVATAFVVVLGIVGLMAAASGPSEAGAGRAVGALLVIVAVGLEIAYAFVGFWLPSQGQVALIAAVYALWFIAWAALAGLRPRAYAGLVVLLVAIAIQVLVPFLLVLNGVWDAWVLIGATTAATAALTLAVVGITRAIDATAGARAPGVADGIATQRVAPDALGAPGQVQPLATTALGLGLGALGAVVLSYLLNFLPVPGVLGLVIGVAFLGLVVGAIVAGHVARGRIRSFGGGGRARATAAMVIGYSVVGLTVVGLVVQLVAWQIAMQAVNSSAGYDLPYDDEVAVDVDDVSDEPSESESPTFGVTCDDLFSPEVVSAANSAGLVLNPEWADGTDPGGLALQDPELASVLVTLPALDCRWLSPNGGSGVGIRSVIAVVDADQAAWLNARFAGLGYRPQNELGSTRYFFEANAGGTPYGESHIVREGIWFATHWLSYGPRGYTADIVTNYFG